MNPEKRISFQPNSAAAFGPSPAGREGFGTIRAEERGG